MGRPYDHEKRLSIAMGALDVLRERGLIGTSMSQIATALGMKRPTLYWYFPDLGAIFECALMHVREQEAAYVAERIQGHPHPVDLLNAFVRAEFSFYREYGHTDFLMLLMQFWAAGPPEHRDRFAELTFKQLAPLRAMMVHGFTMAIESGELKPCDPGALFDLVLCTMDGAMVHHITRGLEPELVADMLQTLVLEPLRGTP